MPDEWAEKRVKCPRCGNAIRVPSESAVPVLRTAAQSVANMTTVPDQVLESETAAPRKERVAPMTKPVTPGAEPVIPIVESAAPRIDPATLGADSETSWSDSEAEGAVEDEGISQEEYQPEPEPKIELELEPQFVNETKPKPKMEQELDPQFVTEAEAVTASKAVSEPKSIGEDFFSDDLLAAMESGQTVERAVKQEKVKCPRCGTLMADRKTCQMCGYSISVSIPATAVSGTSSTTSGSISGMARLALIVAGGLMGAMLGAAIWWGLSYVTHMKSSYAVTGIACLAALGIIFTARK